MYQMIIADDEQIECRGLEMMVQNHFRNIRLLPSVYSGVALIKAVQEQMPDIVIADINMPGLSGLEAIEILRMKSMNTKVIINTAYSNFEYIRKAMVLGASDYLLKPVDEERFKEAISRILSMLDQERLAAKKEEDSEKKLQCMQQIAGNEVMSSIILGKPDQEAFQMWFGGTGRNYQGGILVAGRIETLLNSRIYLQDLEKAASRELKKYCTCVTRIYKDILYFYLIPGEQIDESNYREWIRALLKQVCNGIEDIREYQVRFGVSGWKYDFEEILQAFYECVLAMNKSSIEKICFFEEKEEKNGQLQIFGKNLQELVELIKQEAWEACEEACLKILEQWKGNGNTIEDERVLAAGLVKQCSLILHSQYRYQYLWKAILGRMENCQTTEQMAKLLVRMFREHKDWDDWDDKRSHYIEGAILYIEKNYMRDLSLDEVAGKLGISSFYLSRLLKQQLHTGFVELLTDIRIDRAIELISEEQDMVIKDIGSQVGYQSSSYFYKVFKKSTGMTVGQMRELFHK